MEHVKSLQDVEKAIAGHQDIPQETKAELL